MLKVNDIAFTYDEEKPLLKSINFTLKKGEHLCVMGESGCGKSTLLKVIYGLLDVQGGSIFWNEDQVLGPSYHLIPGIKNFKYVAQDFDLMPYTTVFDNISKFLSRFYPEETKKRTLELLEVIQMTEFADVKVKNLSGGQQQRVAIARALAKEPELLLLDEPFGQIDNFKKRSLRRMLFSYLKEKNIACIVATHDAEDALSFADKMIVIQNNRIIAQSDPQALYKNPQSNYVASLFDDVNEMQLNGKKEYVYPYQLKIISESDLQATVKKSYYKGFYWLIELDCNHQIVFLNHPVEIAPSTKVCLEISK
jgi:ABC-type sulfate/molybdate transport systems ATPase subunit